LNASFEANWEALWARHEDTRSSASSEEKASPKTVKILLREFGRPVRTAFKIARLDIRNDVHWKILLWTLARAIYGKRGPGQKKKWTNKKLRRLVEGIARIKAKYPEYGELKC
jgi:hypothetical protein